jgi:DNA-directed RNA polymerase subunit RPC12/RpoP
MFKCDRCGSRYSSMHAATIENCPRCLIRERVSSPLAFTIIEFQRERTEAQDSVARSETPEGRGQPISA